MRKRRMLLCALAVSAAALLVVPFAYAQATRTWVSGVGDDVNPCSRTAPCKTFAGAISKTAAKGTISVLDPGGFGAVTITKSITLVGPPGMGSILAVGAISAIIINSTNSTGAPLVVKIKNLDLLGSSQSTSPGNIGINIISAGIGVKSVTVENTMIEGFGSTPGTSAGIRWTAPATGGVAGKLYVTNSMIVDNLRGLRLESANASSPISATVKGTNFLDGDVGVTAVGAQAKIQLTDCAVSGFVSFGLFSSGGQIKVDNCSITHNGTGVSGAGILSRGNNTLEDNAAGNTFPGTYGPK